jgi:hypothetical protein
MARLKNMKNAPAEAKSTLNDPNKTAKQCKICL